MRFLMLCLALVSAPAFSAPSCSIPGLPSITGQSYHLARGRLILAGFIPELTPTDPDLAPWIDEPRKRFGYAEVGDCSGTGFAGCTYNWITKSGKNFSVNTSGEDPLFHIVKPKGKAISCDHAHPETLNSPWRPFHRN